MHLGAAREQPGRRDRTTGVATLRNGGRGTSRRSRGVVGRTGKQPETPEQRLRDLRREFRTFEDEDPGPDRASRLARFTRAAHRDRQLNMAMHTAALCLGDDAEPPSLLVEAYSRDEDDETRLDALGDLRDLGRYLRRTDLVEIADDLLLSTAEAWVAAGDRGERRYRLRTVQSLTSREVADEIRERVG